MEWMEMGFNVFYLVVVWGLVITMIVKRQQVNDNEYSVAKYILFAFLLLATGDTGHVGFRVIAYLSGGIDKNAHLVGMGALATAYTVTVFYILILLAWKNRYSKKFNWFSYCLIAAGVFRLVIMLFPANEWGSAVPPFDWSLYRNIPLMIQGIGVAFLIIRDSLKTGDNMFKWIGIMIIISYTCYFPVILFVQKVPIIGVLMMPKTLAYLGAGFIAYNGFYKHKFSSKASRAGSSLGNNSLR